MEDLIVKKRAEGKSERQIAEEVGCSKSKVNKVINSTGQKRPVDLPTEVIGKDGKKRKSTRQIAEEVGVSRQTVLNVTDSTVNNLTVDIPIEVIGKDGKKRKARKTECEQKIVELAQAGLFVLVSQLTQ
jgi:transposase